MRKHAFAAAVAAGLVAGCGPVADALEEARGPGPGGQFGVATRERLDSDPEGRTFRIMIQAKEAASWAEADAAMMKSLDFRCVDGESFAALSNAPEIGSDGYATMHAAGTTFVETYVCAGPYPGESALDPGLSEEDARARVESALVGDGELVAGRHLVTRLSHNDRMRKYEAINRHLGALVAAAGRDCPGGDVVLHALVIGNFPKPERKRHSLNLAEMLVGTDIECVPMAPAAAP